MRQIANNLTQVLEQIKTSAEKCRRAPNDITLLAVSKKQSMDKIYAAYASGQRHFGENYVQEAVEKIEQSQHNDIIWHFIGPIQSNKTKSIAENFSWVDSIDRIKIAQRLNEQRPNHLPPINVCIQVNIDGEETKSGAKPEHVIELARFIQSCDKLKLQGLMAIPQKANESTYDSSPFARMNTLLQQLREEIGAPDLTTLSMGMSADMDEAIQHGATFVRIGTAIFGERPR